MVTYIRFYVINNACDIETGWDSYVVKTIDQAEAILKEKTPNKTIKKKL